ncbi:transcriptional regulator [Salmonella enterica subsp. enterica]|nr:transcriptional regulator [Salmonella enterica subsp. enterica]
MDSSFTPIEQMLKFRASRHEDFPYQEILLTRLLYAHARQAPGKPQ